MSVEKEKNYTLVDINDVLKKLTEGSNWLKNNNNTLKYNRTPFELKEILEFLVSTDIVKLIKDVETADKWHIEGYGHFKDVTNTVSDAPNIAVNIIKSKIKEIYDLLELNKEN